MTAALAVALLLATLIGSGESDMDDVEIHDEAPATVTLSGSCSAYVATGSRTRTGTVPQWGTVAVDPSVIALGTRLHIDGFDMTFVAEDTGGMVRGSHVDIFMLSYSDAIRYGRRACTIRIIQ